MANTTLRAYIDELKFLLDREALEEVMGHCRHILQHFPKNIEVYRLLGRSLLEKDRHQEAADVFQRVLSAIPDDFVAHLGLSGIAEESGDVPQAIWHLESAYEQEPNNAALRQEVRRLYERRDGFTPDRIPLSAGGLAQAYVKGRLYEQAVSELSSALEQMPDRVELRLKLAQVLWETDRHVEAAEAALLVLDKLPNSIEANRLVATLWLKAGRPSDAAPFISRLEQLDPFLAWATVNPEQPLPAGAFALPHLDWDARTAAALASDVPDWVNAISNVFDAPESVSLAGGVPNWLEDVSAPTPAPVKPASARSSLLNSRRPSEAENTASSVADDVPDWFREVPLASSPTPDATAPGSPASDVPDWFKDVAALDKGPEEALPPSPLPAEPMRALSADWLDDDDMPSAADMLESESDDDASRAILEEISASAEPTPLDAMSWLKTGPLPPLPDLVDEMESPSESEAEAPSLDWLTNSGGNSSQSEPAEVLEPAATDDQDPMAWLRPYNPDVADNVDAAYSDPITGSSQFSEQTVDNHSNDNVSDSSADEIAGFDWLDNTELASDAPAPAPIYSDFAASQVPDVSREDGDDEADEDGDDGDDDADAWLANFTNTGDSASRAPAPGLDWLTTEDSEDSGAAASSPNEANPELEEDWLASFEIGQGTSPAADTIGNARSSFAAPDESDSEASSSPALSSVDDWLAATGSAESAVDNSLPDWMSQADAAPAANDGADWLSNIGTPPQPGRANTKPISVSLDDFDFGSLESNKTTEPEASEAPDWLTSMTPPTKTSTQSTAAISLEDLGIDSLESDNVAAAEPDESEIVAGETPDWLSTMVRPAQPNDTDSGKPISMTLDDLDFGSMESGGASGFDMEDAPEGAADWLSAMAPPTPAAAASSPPKPTAMTLDDLDFEKLSHPSESVEPVQGDVPDWLSAFGGEAVVTPESQSLPIAEPGESVESTELVEPVMRARHAMPEHFPEVDFDKLPVEAQPANAGGGTDMDFDFGGVAQPANLMNTNKDQGSQSFTFEQKPAWMRKGKTQRIAPGQSTKQDDLPDWSDSSAKTGSDADDSVPDWLKDLM